VTNVSVLNATTPIATLRAAASLTGWGKEKKLFTTVTLLKLSGLCADG
jgi:hypothetical protein